jgi:hypothetical protein
MEKDSLLGWRWSQILLLCSFAFCIYLIVIFILGTLPFSDFRTNYETALAILRGEGIGVRYKYFQPAGYPYLLSIAFTLFNSHSILIPQLLNAIMLCGLLWMYLRSLRGDHSICLFIGYLILMFNVNYLSMVSVLCSEIPFVFFFLTGWFCFWRGFKEIVVGKRCVLPFMASGLLLGTSQFIRPVALTYLFVFSMVMALGFRYFKFLKMNAGWKVLFLRSLRPLILTWVTFFGVSVLFYWGTGYGLTYMPFQKGLWNLYVGFNSESKGAYSPRDAELMTKLGYENQWNAKKINKVLKGIASERIKRNWLKNVQNMPEKLYKLMDPGTIPYWAVEQSNIKDKGSIYKLSWSLCWINWGVLVVSLWTCVIWLAERKIGIRDFFTFCALVTAFLYLIIHSYLFEVQGRYSSHLWMVMFVSFPVSLRALRHSVTKGII